jgi:hypothetical protein
MIVNIFRRSHDKKYCEGGGSVADVVRMYHVAGTLNIYLTNSIRVIKKPPRWGQGSSFWSAEISRPYFR